MGRMSKLSAGLLAWLMLVAPALAHPPTENGQQHTHPEDAAPGIAHRTSGLVLPEMTGSGRPWSQQAALSDPQRFHFAVMTDNTGGHRPGVWMHGVNSLNLLRPDFVVSVGDLIEGYSQDEAEVERQWKEFLGFIDQLQMKFFFVAGNHDVTNPLMHSIWRKHFGAEWYSFDYNDVHFVCLCSEDPRTTLGEDQLSWLKNDLEEHANARWTFLFFHKPLWVFAEREIAAGNPDSTQWKRVEAMLGSRPHTVFAGHVHHYVQYQRNGTQYYHLATTGGGSRLRGTSYGEFDHVTWVTMEADGPRIANLLLDGVLAPDVVTEESISRFRKFLNQMQVAIAPILVEERDTLQEGEILLQLDNEFDELITIEGTIHGIPLQGLTLEPEKITAEIPPHGRKVVKVRFHLEKPLELDQFRQVNLTALLRSEDQQPVQAELTVPVTIDRHHDCQPLRVTLDGDLKEWTGRELEFAKIPTLFGAKDQWQGPGDATVRFRTHYDHEFLYLGGEVTDDSVVPNRDLLVFSLDARPLKARQQQPELGTDCYTIELQPVGDGTTAVVELDARVDAGRQPQCQHTYLRTRSGYRFEIAVPIQLITGPQGEAWEGFQLNTVLRDIDEPQDADVYILWRPALDIQEKNVNFAFFRRIAPADQQP